MKLKTLFFALLFALSTLTVSTVTYNQAYAGTSVERVYLDGHWWLITYVDGVKVMQVIDDID